MDIGTAPVTVADFVTKSPLQPTRSEEAEAAGSVMEVAEAKTSAPSRKARSGKGAAEGE